MKLKRNSDSAVEPLTLQLVQDHLRVDSDFDQELISEYIKAAREQFEYDADMILTNQTWTMYCDVFPEDQVITIPISPVQSVESVKYYDEDGTLQTLSSSLYFTDLIGKNPIIKSTQNDYFPATEKGRPNAVEIAFTAGYADPVAEVTNDVKQALMILIGHFNENRQEVVHGIKMNVVPFGYQRIMQQYKNYLGR